MKPRALLNLALLAAVGGLGLTLFLSRETPAEEAPLTALTPEGITQIRLEHPDQEPIELQREGERWRLVAPVAGEADALEVRGILNVARLPVKRDVDADADRAALGLAPPEFTLTLDDEVLHFGALEPLAFQRYIGTARGIALVDNPPSAALDADFSDLLSKRLFAEDRRIVALRMPEVSVEATGEGWVSESHPDIPAADWAAWIDEWQAAQAMWNVSALEVSREAGDWVEVRLDDGHEEALLVARLEPQLELINPRLRVQYTLSRALVDRLLSAPEPPPAPADDTVE